MSQVGTSLYTRTCNTPPYIVELFLMHYRPYVGRITVFDDGSDLAFCEGLQSHMATGMIDELVAVERDARDPEVRMRPAMKARWQSDPARVVVCLDIDELLFPPERLGEAISIHRPVGYEVYGWEDTFEVPKRRQLMRFDPYDKPASSVRLIANR
jgi:hypothetical protein